MLNIVFLADAENNAIINEVFKNALGIGFSILSAFLIFLAKLLFNMYRAKSDIKKELLNIKKIVLDNKDSFSSENTYIVNPISTIYWDIYKNDSFSGLTRNYKNSLAFIYKKIDDLNTLVTKKSEYLVNEKLKKPELGKAIGLTINQLCDDIVDRINSFYKVKHE